MLVVPLTLPVTFRLPASFKVTVPEPRLEVARSVVPAVLTVTEPVVVLADTVTGVKVVPDEESVRLAVPELVVTLRLEVEREAVES